MLWLKRLRLRIRSIVHRPALERDLEQELQFHMAEQRAEFLSLGMTDSEAELAVRRSFGNAGGVAEQCRDHRHSRGLAEPAGLRGLLDAHVRFDCERVGSGAANATGKLTAIVAGLAAGADCIEDLDLVRAGGMRRVFGGVYAAATLGIILRAFSFGHAAQLAAMQRRHLLALADRTSVLDG